MAKKKLRRGEGSVAPYLLADGTQKWRARWYDDRRVRSQSFASKKAAEEHLISLSTEKRLGTYVQALDITVEDAVSRYLVRSANRWTTNTFATYRQIAKTHIYPHIGKERMATLTTARLQSWLDQISRKEVGKGKNRRKLSPSVVDNARIIVSGTCAELVRLGELSRNPVSGVRTSAKRRKHKVTWDEEQVKAVLAAAHEISPTMEVMYRVALTTGMRPGEVRALMWKDIDFDNGTITCQRTVTRDADFRQIIGTDTKTHKARTIAVPASTIAALKAMRRGQVQRRLAAERWNPTDLVFERGDGNLMPQQTIFDKHKAICKAAGVPRIRMHDTRHTAATLLLRRGVNAKIVSEILGHHSISMTLDIYQHVSVDMQRDATNILGAIADEG